MGGEWGVSGVWGVLGDLGVCMRVCMYMCECVNRILNTQTLTNLSEVMGWV